jgi:hypothetical protein
VKLKRLDELQLAGFQRVDTVDDPDLPSSEAFGADA